jgi:hypothetical protein
MTPTDNEVALVRIMKSMREMDCEPFLGDQDEGIGDRWIIKVEKTLI